MPSYHIHFPGFDCDVTVSGGTVAEACRLTGHPLDLVCGGNGKCGKCAVKILRRGKEEVVLACHTVIDCDMSIYLPEAPAKATILTTSESVGIFAPMLRKEFIPAENLKPAHCGAFLEKAPLSVLRAFSAMDRAAGITLVYFGGEIIDVQRGNTSHSLYGCAVDIGTTTVAMYLYDMTCGTLLETLSALNGQIRRGGDVIARIQYAIEHKEGLTELQSDILTTVNGLLDEAEKKHPQLKENLYHLVFCGNSTMQHLFLGLDPSALGLDPFASITAHGVTATAGELGLAAPARAAVDFLPLLGGFVGADTASVLLTLPMDDKIRLMVDLGTNGEIAIGSHARGYLTASTACGPALEGGSIDCGMRATAGAIDRLTVTADGRLDYHVLGGGSPKGLCGSGIIDTVAALLCHGLVEESGRLLSSEEYEEEHPASPLSKRLMQLEDGSRVFAITEDASVYLSQKDIRQIQLAKSAICAGCLTLAAEFGMDVAAVDELVLAGAFGNYIDRDNALQIGLLPPVNRETVRPVGNAAGLGVQLCLLDRNTRTRCEELRASVRHVELSRCAAFMDHYVEQMSFDL